jgi:hypothetical protein
LISSIAAPSVCLVDDEEADYRPMLKALQNLHISCLHFEGNDLTQLPDTPFDSLRIVFTDLHLISSLGKTGASHTANVFRRLVSVDTTPVVVVIWSKFSDETTHEPSEPVDDQPTDEALFRQTLIEAEPKFKGRLIFVRMPKPKLSEGRPQDGEWIEQLRLQIQNVLENQDGVKALWAWESLVNQCGRDVSARLTALSCSTAHADCEWALNAELRKMMQKLCAAQSEGDLSVQTAPRHLTSVLAQLLVDELEHKAPNPLGEQADWLATKFMGTSQVNLNAKLNTLLMTAHTLPDPAPYLPGVVYKITNEAAFATAFGSEVKTLRAVCFSDKPTHAKWAEWDAGVVPVLIELSPTCDVANDNRTTASLVAGLLVPSSVQKLAHKNDAWSKTASFMLRSSTSTGVVEDKEVALVFCARYKLTLPVVAKVAWLDPLFRMRELHTTQLRNWLAGQAARVGLVTL